MDSESKEKFTLHFGGKEDDNSIKIDIQKGQENYQCGHKRFIINYNARAIYCEKCNKHFDAFDLYYKHIDELNEAFERKATYTNEFHEILERIEMAEKEERNLKARIKTAKQKLDELKYYIGKTIEFIYIENEWVGITEDLKGRVISIKKENNIFLYKIDVISGIRHEPEYSRESNIEVKTGIREFSSKEINILSVQGEVDNGKME